MRKTIFLISAVVLLGIILRIYRFSDTLLLTDGQAIAYLLADRVVNLGHTVAAGHVTAIRGFYIHPPTYYYLISILYYVTAGNETVITLFFAMANSIAIWLVYLTGKEFAGRKAALIASFMFSFSAIMASYGRNIWEPHLVPLLILLAVFLLKKAYDSGNWTLLTLSVFSFLTSLMYVSSFLLLPFYLFFLLKTSLKSGGKPGLFKALAVLSGVSLIFFGSYIRFESASGFSSITALLDAADYYFTGGFWGPAYFGNVINYFSVFIRSMFPSDMIWIKLFFAAAALYPIFKKRVNGGIRIFSAALIFSFFISAFYNIKMYPYRFAAFYPLIFILSGSFIHELFTYGREKVLKYASLLFLVLFFSGYFWTNINEYLRPIIHKSRYDYHRIYSEGNKLAAVMDPAGDNLYVMVNRDYGLLESVYLHDAEPEKNIIPNTQRAAYLWVMERLSGKRFISLNRKGNWIEESIIRGRPLFLVCIGFPKKEENRCPQFFAGNVREARGFFKDHTRVEIDGLILYRFEPV